MSLTSIKIPDSVTSIGTYTFYNCVKLTSFKIPDSVTSISEGIFKDCTGLISIELPEYITSIGNYAFSGCTSLTSIEIPNSVTAIGIGSFRDCNKLASVTCMWDEPIKATNDIFTQYNCPLYVPAGTKSKYMETKPWSLFNQIIEKDVISIKADVIEKDVKVLAIDGTIYVNSNETVRIIALNGATVYSGYGDCSVNVAKGIYIVIVGGKAHKVSV